MKENDVVKDDEIGKEQTSRVYFLTNLKEGNKAICIDGVCNGEEVTIYLFKHTNNKFYYICPQKIVKAPQFNEIVKKNNEKEYMKELKEKAVTIYKNKYGVEKDENKLKAIEKELMNYKPKDFDDMLDICKKEYSKLVNSHSFYIKVDNIASSTSYKEEQLIYNKSKIKLKLFLNDNNKKMYIDAPSLIEKVNSYKLVRYKDIKNVAYGIETIKQCKNVFEIDKKTPDSYVIHRETPESDRYDILDDDNVKEFYYESDDNERFLIKKDDNKKDRLSCKLDDNTFHPCTFDSDGYLKVLIE